MESQKIQPNDLVALIYVPGMYYGKSVSPGAVGTAIRRISPPDFAPQNEKYWEVSFPTAAELYCCDERMLRKIDGDGRQVGRWDFCVFNAPKFVKEQRLEMLERMRGD